MNALSLIFEFADFNVSDLAHAAELEWDDFEDAIQSVTAERVHADYIITRNVRDFAGSKVAALTPAELIARIDQLFVSAGYTPSVLLEGDDEDDDENDI